MMTKNKLATIQEIEELKPIENADRIERATIRGWQVVVRKDDFEEGDPCVYCQIDSVLPPREEFEFLKPRGYRIKTIRLRGVLSQGIAFPLSILSSVGEIQEREDDFVLFVDGKEKKTLTLGSDVTELLGVKKHEKPFTPDGEIKAGFPSFIPKTDEVRIKSYPKALSRKNGMECYVTEKLDGTSATYYYVDGTFGVCSRNREWHESDGQIQWILSKKYEIKEILERIGENLAIQGEIVGKKIQGNPYSMEGMDLFVFDVFGIDQHEFMCLEDLKTFTEKHGLKHVPVIDPCLILNGIEELELMSRGKSHLNEGVEREGIVVRSREEMTDFELGRFSFKIINPKYDMGH